MNKSSSTAITSHALLEENDLDVSPQPKSFDASSILFVVSNDVRKDFLLATQVPHSGVVHNKKVGSDRGKFLITDVWEGMTRTSIAQGHMWRGI